MKPFAYLISIGLLTFVFTQNILCQTVKSPTEKQLGAAWQEYQQAMQAAENGDPQNTERLLLAAIETAKKSLNKTAEGLIDFELGEFHQTFRRPHKARIFFELSSAIYRESGDELAEQRSLIKMASAIKKAEPARAEEIFKKALIVFDKHNAFYDRAVGLRLLSDAQTENLRYDDAKKTALESLDLIQKYGEPFDEILVLQQLGILEYRQNNFKASRQFLEQAVTKLDNSPGTKVEVQLLLLTGRLEQSSRQSEAAISNYQKALSLSEQKKLLPETVDALIFIGGIQTMSGQINPAQQGLERALQVAKEFDMTEAAANAANTLGIVYMRATAYPKAIEVLEFAVEGYKKVGSQRLLGSAYINLAMVYNLMGDIPRTTEYRNKALEVQNKFKGIPEKHMGLYARGQKCLQDKNFPEAKKYFNELLESAQQYTDSEYEALAREKLGEIALQENKPSEAQESFLAAQDIYVKLKSDYGLACVKKDIGDTFTVLKEFDQARESYGQSLYFFRLSESIAGEAEVFSRLMKSSQAEGKMRLATFFGKQSVSLLQKLRGSLSSLDIEIQKNFITSNEDIYRTLASMLIEGQRLTEAQQIIALLKEDEYFQYTNRKEKIPETQIPQVSLNTQEALASEQYKKLTDRLYEISKKAVELQQKRTTAGFSKEEQEELTAFKTELSQLNMAFVDYLRQTQDQLAEASPSPVSNTLGGENWKKRLADWNNEAVLINTLITENHTYLILTTSTKQISHRIDISASELKKKIENFREVLADPRREVSYYTKYFHETLFAPIAKPIREAKAKILLLSLDGNLRYIPFAALHDGKRFLVEEFTTVAVTLAQIPEDLVANSRNRRGLGAGVSESIGNFPPLPNVAIELQAIIREEKNPNDTGLFPGKLLLNRDFTRKNFTENLQEKFDFILIASHFELNDKDANSFLLLGNGEKLDLATFRTAPEFTLKGTELLILSACNTGRSPADGVEVESFAVLAQKRGARSVLASLWKVADESTANLMTNFFTNYQKQNSAYAKARILRDGQLKLLRSINTKNFSHPYYWSPFIILGKWR